MANNFISPPKPIMDPFTKGLIDGDEDMISKIYHKFFPKVLQYISKNSGTLEEAKDIFQESLIHIIVGIKENRINVQNLEAYLFTTCKNNWRRQAEKKKKWVMNLDVVTLKDKDTDFAAFFLEQEQMQLYREKFNLLSDNCKEVLSLLFNNVSYESIVQELSYATINTARQRIFKCKSKLVKLIKEDKRFKSEGL